MEMDGNGQAPAAVNGIPPISTLSTACSDVIRELAPDDPAEQARRAELARKREEERRQEREEFLQHQARHVREELQQGFGTRYKNCTFDNYAVECPEQEKVVTASRAYVEKFPEHYKAGQGVVYFGPPGTGKDHLAAAIAFGVFDRWAKWEGSTRIRFRSGLELYQAIRDGMTDHTTEWEITSPDIQASLLILSDPLPPRGPLTDWQAGILLNIIDARYRSMKPTIVTLNIANGAEGDERMGAQTLDRLKDGALSFFCNWPSHRKAQS
jgi:DNA replication protein DnaC